jgi:hypothetical protein
MAVQYFSENQKQIMMKSLMFQRQDLKKQIDELDALISQIRSELTVGNPIDIQLRTRSRNRTDEGRDQFNERVIEVLSNSFDALTSRQIVNQIKEKYIEIKNLDKVGDRKYMANISATITNKLKDGSIIRLKEEGKDATYKLKE